MAAHFVGAGAGGSSEWLSGELVVKDSDGAALWEGDSVTMLKDLKRGTPIRKIHLVGAPEVIECRLDGSALALKTCFLKKALPPEYFACQLGGACLCPGP